MSWEAQPEKSESLVGVSECMEQDPEYHGTQKPCGKLGTTSKAKH